MCFGIRLPRPRVLLEPEKGKVGVLRRFPKFVHVRKSASYAHAIENMPQLLLGGLELDPSPDSVEHVEYFPSTVTLWPERS